MTRKATEKELSDVREAWKRFIAGDLKASQEITGIAEQMNTGALGGDQLIPTLGYLMYQADITDDENEYAPFYAFSSLSPDYANDGIWGYMFVALSSGLLQAKILKEFNAAKELSFDGTQALINDERLRKYLVPFNKNMEEWKDRLEKIKIPTDISYHQYIEKMQVSISKIKKTLQEYHDYLIEKYQLPNSVEPADSNSLPERKLIAVNALIKGINQEKKNPIQLLIEFKEELGNQQETLSRHQDSQEKRLLVKLLKILSLGFYTGKDAYKHHGLFGRSKGGDLVDGLMTELPKPADDSDAEEIEMKGVSLRGSRSEQ
ncbi:MULTISPECIES: hypothetical protein [unclassified Legionella]|uniref:hypothetical protein n=1 Tax=unclassified Legionella TaxID=2622702 RepID=UPI001056A33F|nr:MULTISPECIES: hypothetical protein [unclassified Legionella]MDI9818169.1 hypothetical protein [Legionella sp. PL877]